MVFVEIDLVRWLTVLLGVGLGLFMAYFGLVSWQEREPKAMKRALLLAMVVPIPYMIAGMVGGTAVSILLLTLTILFGLILILPIGNRFPVENDTPPKRIDERDIMFSRAHLPVDWDAWACS